MMVQHHYSSPRGHMGESSRGESYPHRELGKVLPSLRHEAKALMEVRGLAAAVPAVR